MAPGWLHGDGRHVTDDLFPRQGAAETGGAIRARQIVDRQGPERVSHTGFVTFTGKSQASFGQLPVVLGDQHRGSALQPLAKGSRRCSFRRNSALPAGSSGAAFSGGPRRRRW
jgi:hypothetical protein